MSTCSEMSRWHAAVLLDMRKMLTTATYNGQVLTEKIAALEKKNAQLEKQRRAAVVELSAALAAYNDFLMAYRAQPGAAV